MLNIEYLLVLLGQFSSKKYRNAMVFSSLSTVKIDSLVVQKRYSPFMADSRLPVNRLSLTSFALLGYNTSAVRAIWNPSVGALHCLTFLPGFIFGPGFYLLVGLANNGPFRVLNQEADLVCLLFLSIVLIYLGFWKEATFCMRRSENLRGSRVVRKPPSVACDR